MRCWWLLVALALPRGSSGDSLLRHHAVLLSTGSHETRLSLYSESGGSIEGHTLGKIVPGLRNYIGQHNIPRAVAALLPLFEKVKKLVPKVELARTRVFVYGTAGMRELQQTEFEELWNGLYESLRELGPQKFPFLLRREDFQVLTGEREGFFAGLAVNWLLERINAGAEPITCAAAASQHLVGAFDLGSTSAQLASPLKQAGCDDLPGQRRGRTRSRRLRESDFWSVSLETYGIDEVFEAVTTFISENLKEEGGANPCFNAGISLDALHVGEDRQIRAEGNGPACREMISLAIWGDQDSKCLRDHSFCLLDGIAVARRAHRSEFVAMRSSYTVIDVLRQHSPKGLPSWPTPPLEEIRASADALCAMPWGDLSRSAVHEPANDWNSLARLLPELCLKANYISVLWRGMGFEPNSRNVLFAANLRDTHVDWTVGAALEYFSKMAYRRPQSHDWNADVMDMLALGAMTCLMFVTCYFVIVQAKFLYQWLGPRGKSVQGFAKKVDATPENADEETRGESHKAPGESKTRSDEAPK